MKNKYYSSRKFMFVIIGVIVLLAALIGWKLYDYNANSGLKSSSQINSFDQCVAAGNAVLETYPEQCTANGKTFTKQY